jgi:predicted regulator of Ras-like GTPase activity (Roadblock/LC7/MglB family)
VEANAKVVFLIDKNGQQIASAGDVAGLDPTSLASLTAGNVAATDGLAKLLGEREFSILFHEGEHDNLHINVVGGRAILVVLFDERSSLGLVRLRVKKATGEIGAVLEDVVTRSMSQRPGGGSPSPFTEITDEDIDALFN